MKIALIALALVLSASRHAHAQDCLHGPNQTPEQAQRTRAALAVVRIVNTLENESLNVRGKLLSRGDVSRSPDLTEFNTVGADFGKDEVLPGFELRLMSEGKRYMVTITDTTDPCHFSFVSDERGTIVKGEVIR